MIIIWKAIGLLTASIIILFLLFLLESVINAKIDEISERRRMKKTLNKYFSEVENRVNEEIDKLFEEEWSDDEE